MCGGGHRRRVIEERWQIWLLTAWSILVNMALFAFAILVAVKATELKPTDSPIKSEDTAQEEHKDGEEANLVRVLAFIVAVVLLGELVVHVLLVVAMVLEKSLKKAPKFVIAYIVCQIIMLIVLCTLLIFDFLSLLRPHSTQEKVLFALLCLASIIRRALSLIMYTKYYSILRWPAAANPLHTTAVVPRVLSERSTTSTINRSRIVASPRRQFPGSTRRSTSPLTLSVTNSTTHAREM